jgi:hypothetical protein
MHSFRLIPLTHSAFNPSLHPLGGTKGLGLASLKTKNLVVPNLTTLGEPIFRVGSIICLKGQNLNLKWHQKVKIAEYRKFCLGARLRNTILVFSKTVGESALLPMALVSFTRY